MTILGKLTATMTSTAFNTSLDSTPVNSFDFQRDGNSHFSQRNENNLKGNFCLVLRKSCKPALDKATYFQTLSNQFILQIKILEKASTTRQHSIKSVNVYLHFKLSNSKRFSRNLNLAQILASDGG